MPTWQIGCRDVTGWSPGKRGLRLQVEFGLLSAGLTVGSTSRVLGEEEGAAGRMVDLALRLQGGTGSRGVKQAPQKLHTMGLGASWSSQKVRGPAFTLWAHLGLLTTSQGTVQHPRRARSLPEPPEAARPCLCSVDPPRTSDCQNHFPRDCSTPPGYGGLLCSNRSHMRVALSDSVSSGGFSEHPPGPQRTPCVLPLALKASAPPT